MTPREISTALLDALPEPARSALARTTNLAGWLGESVDSARRTWRGVDLDTKDFVGYLAEKIGALAEPSAYRRLRTADLYIARACIDKSPEAIARFEERYLPEIDRALKRFKISPSTANDLQGALRERLFFGDAGAPALLGDYSGRGALGSWLRSVAVHLAMKAKKREARQVDEEEALDVLVSNDNPEIQFLRRTRAKLFEEAIARALRELSVRERNILRQHYWDGLNVDALGKLYRVHRATAARWVASARESLLANVKKELAGRLTPSDIESLLRATKDDLGARISQMFRVTES